MQQQYIISSSCKATPTKFMLLISFISLIFLSVLIEAAPVRSVLTEVNNLRSFANYAAAAYCKVPLENWDCNVCKANDKTEVVRIIRNEELHTKGFIAMDHLRKIIVIAFRGTVHYKNLVTDLKVIKTDYDPVPDAKVHRGFYEAFREVQPQVTDEVLRLFREHPDFDIGFIGHSLGGALAALAALDLIQKEPSLGGHNEKLFLKTFGQPRIGDEAFAEYVDNNVRVLRSIVRGDPVPRLPPSGEYPVIGNYRHFGEELYIDRPKDDSNAFVQCGVEDPACSASIPLKKLKVRVHSGPYYDVKMSDCKDGGSDDDDDDDLDDIDDDEFNEEAFGDDDGGDDDDGDDDDGDDDDDDD